MLQRTFEMKFPGTESRCFLLSLTFQNKSQNKIEENSPWHLMLQSCPLQVHGCKWKALSVYLHDPYTLASVFYRNTLCQNRCHSMPQIMEPHALKTTVFQKAHTRPCDVSRLKHSTIWPYTDFIQYDSAFFLFGFKFSQIFRRARYHVKVSATRPSLCMLYLIHGSCKLRHCIPDMQYVICEVNIRPSQATNFFPAKPEHKRKS